MLPTSRCRYARGINTSSIPHDLVILSKPAQDSLVDALPNTGLHPFVKATPAGHAAASPKVTRQVFPRYSVLRTNRKPMRAARSLIRGRLPFGERLWAGRCSSISDQRSSGRSACAMTKSGYENGRHLNAQTEVRASTSAPLRTFIH